MADADTNELLGRLVSAAEAQVELLKAISAKLDDLNQGIVSVSDGLIR